MIHTQLTIVQALYHENPPSDIGFSWPIQAWHSGSIGTDSEKKFGIILDRQTASSAQGLESRLIIGTPDTIMIHKWIGSSRSVWGCGGNRTPSAFLGEGLQHRGMGNSGAKYFVSLIKLAGPNSNFAWSNRH